VAYFSMEIGLSPELPTYSGGLGVLAGDTIRSAADLGLDLAAVTLLHRRGHFRQRLDAAGRQHEEDADWPFEEHLTPVEPRVTVDIEGRPVLLRGWRYDVVGVDGSVVPVYLLDADQPENEPADRRLTDHLYGGDERYRLCQEVILGIGGVHLLRAVGARPGRFHLNEGHAALAVLALLEENLDDADEATLRAALEALRPSCVFTTHTPVSAGHDRFPRDLVRSVLGETRARHLQWMGQKDVLNMTDLALRSAGFVNGVAMRHGEVSRDMFPDHAIQSITNGVHPPTWASPAMQELFDRYVPRWREDPMTLRYAVGIPSDEIARAHEVAKAALVERVQREAPAAGFRPDVLTLGFARRSTAYKRGTLVFHDPQRLARIAERAGQIQLVFAGKAHPADETGKALITRVFEAAEALRGRVAVAYLADYDMSLAKVLVAGCDVWLNNPVPPLEASGTSGMKAALNGVPSLSILDGWWVEGHVEGVTGWAIGSDEGHRPERQEDRDAADARALYDKLEYAVLPTFYARRRTFHRMMRSAIALNASFFNTQRMLLQYLYAAYSDPRGR
jgi:starch phosphorylase